MSKSYVVSIAYTIVREVDIICDDHVKRAEVIQIALEEDTRVSDQLPPGTKAIRRVLQGAESREVVNVEVLP